MYEYNEKNKVNLREGFGTKLEGCRKSVSKMTWYITNLNIHTEEVLLAGRVVLRLGEIVPELLDISIEVIDRGRRNKAEDLHAAIHADPELPAVAFNGNSCLQGSNGLNTAISSKPRHVSKSI
jgi:hypothetical protein